MPERFNPEYKEYFNQRLTLGIQILKGNCAGEKHFKGAIATTIGYRDEMREQGARWQAERLTEWIKRALRNGGFLHYAE